MFVNICKSYIQPKTLIFYKVEACICSMALLTTVFGPHSFSLSMPTVNCIVQPFLSPSEDFCLAACLIQLCIGDVVPSCMVKMPNSSHIHIQRHCKELSARPIMPVSLCDPPHFIVSCVATQLFKQKLLSHHSMKNIPCIQCCILEAAIKISDAQAPKFCKYLL